MTSVQMLRIAQKQLGLDDDTYRDKLETLTGKRSTRDLSERERQKVYTAFQADGFVPKRPAPKAGRATGKFAPKLQALWIAGWNLGVVKNRTDKAMLAFLFRQTGIEHSRFLHHGEDANKVIEALKAWLKREMVSKELGLNAVGFFTFDKSLPPTLNDHRYQIVQLQWGLLVRADQQPGTLAGFLLSEFDIDRPLSDLTDKEWISIMNRLGELVRRI
ncbi:protein gp16 [Roseibium sp. TrichSKD4]|uniref:regulatory protein GemA n=1 Tax=Roseibium sp. TrichSKD4 TaxID=744980 RepID=UPI0001E56D33|nr:regulatory protein GemA [Roseibium sp. TrichSKD4]EFO33244.1 protein gp16 [Roseibium sp. TrichSKD4]